MDAIAFYTESVPGPIYGSPAAPSCSLKINNGDATTDSLNVSLQITMNDGGAGQMLISNDSTFLNANWENFATSKSWALAGAASGPKTVYLTLKTTDSQLTQPCSATIQYNAPTQTELPTGYEGLILTDPQSAGSLANGASIGELVKTEDSNAVYFIDNDNRRHAFPDLNTYNSWFVDFSNVQVISSQLMSDIPLGSNMLIRTGTYLIKIASIPKTYAVEPYGVLRWIKTEELAQQLYGNDWNSNVVDVAAGQFTDYQVGPDITTPVHPTGSIIQYTGETTLYYIESGQKRLISTEVYGRNLLQEKFIDKNISAAITYTSAADWPIIAIEDLVKLR
jgi:hypothetical protein